MHRLILAVLSAIALACSSCSKRAPDETKASAVADAASSVDTGADAPAAAVVPVDELPLAGPDGVDRFGHPRRMPDVIALRSMLIAGEFGALTRTIEGFQAAFEADWRREGWVVAALGAFNGDELRGPLDAWVKAVPDSFAPWAARGAARVAAGSERRGGAFRAKTSEEQFSAMRAEHASARADLERALTLRPGLVAAHFELLEIMMMGGAPRTLKRAQLDAALAACPHCGRIRQEYMATLAPRWGGSHDEMEAFAIECAADTKNPRLALLLGSADADRARTLNDANDFEGALVAAERAVARGPFTPFLGERSRARNGLGDSAGALADLDAAVGLAPLDPEWRIRRARLLASLQRWEDAAADAMEAKRLAPADQRALAEEKTAHEGLLFAAATSYRAGDMVAAGRLYQTILLLWPDDQVARDWGRVAAARADTAAPPLLDADGPELTFEQAVARDRQLARSREWPAIVRMWNRYIEKNPGDASAFLERCGTYTQLRDLEHARADCQRACELGNSQSCALVKQIDAKTARER